MRSIAWLCGALTGGLELSPNLRFGLPRSRPRAISCSECGARSEDLDFRGTTSIHGNSLRLLPLMLQLRTPHFFTSHFFVSLDRKEL